MNILHSSLKKPPSELDYLISTIKSSVYQIAKITPLQKMERLSKTLQNTILVKREDCQLMHSFKLRGAYNMIHKLPYEKKKNGVITASAGNHAQGVALSTKKMEIPSLIIMPSRTADIKVNAVKRLKAKVLLYGNNFDEAKNKAIEIANQKNYTYIPPFDHPDIIAGQATIGMELLQQDQHINRIFVPVGGGGLISGIAIFIKQIMPTIKIIAVEAEDSASLNAALSTGYPLKLPQIGLFAEGVAVKQIGNENFRLCKKYIDDIIIVKNDDICLAIKDLFEDTRAIAEPAGALALAGLKKYVQKKNIKEERLVHILSGANINFNSFRNIIKECEFKEKNETLFSISFLRSGDTDNLNVYKIFSEYKINEFHYYYNENLKKINIFFETQLKDKEIESKKIINFFRSMNYKIKDLSNSKIVRKHTRYMLKIDHKNIFSKNTKIFSFIFQEFPNGLSKFIKKLHSSNYWDYVYLLDYRNRGNDHGNILVAFKSSKNNNYFSKNAISKLGYEFKEETENLEFNFFK